MSVHKPTARSVALSAVIEEAITEAAEDSASSYRWRSGVDRGDVERRTRQQDFDVSQRTVDRALKDADALGWVDSRRQGWDAGDRAAQYALDEGTPDMATPSRSKGATSDAASTTIEETEVWSCHTCQNIVLGEERPDNCPECWQDGRDLVSRNKALATEGNRG